MVRCVLPIKDGECTHSELAQLSRSILRNGRDRRIVSKRPDTARLGPTLEARDMKTLLSQRLQGSKTTWAWTLIVSHL